MNSIFTCAMAILLVLLMNQGKGNHHNINDNDLVRVGEFYDAVIDLITYKDNDYNCETRMNNLRNLLDDNMENKDSFISVAKTHCNEYKQVKDLIEIKRNSNSIDLSISLSVILEHLQMDDCQMTKTYDEVITYNSKGLITKIKVPLKPKESKTCSNTDENDEKHYKNEQIRELHDKMGRMACKSKSDKVDDDDIKNKFCLNMEYKAICNNYDKCGDYAGNLEGRDSFLEFIGQYQDMFDDTTVSLNLDDNKFLVKYRKGLCSGNYGLRVNIEYDDDNKCISSWTDYWDDLIISDKDCHNSNDKWVNKILTQCKYDDELEEEAKDTPILVKRERGMN